MESPIEVSDPSQLESIPAAYSFLVRYRFVPWMLGLLVAALMHFAFGWALPFVIAVGLIVSLLGSQLESYLASRSTAKIETQLADAIDLMVAALGREPASTMPWTMPCANRAALCVPNWKKWWVVSSSGRILGRSITASRSAFPLETFLLFSSALSVQSETGGSLAPTLASVGRTIRDRIEIARRIRSNSAQSEVSTFAVLLLTYFIALVVWRTNPEQMGQFLVTSVGQWAVAGTILMQAAGLVWMSFISRLRF